MTGTAVASMTMMLVMYVSERWWVWTFAQHNQHHCCSHPPHLTHCRSHQAHQLHLPQQVTYHSAGNVTVTDARNKAS